jgi:hypothetical protein
MNPSGPHAEINFRVDVTPQSSSISSNIPALVDADLDVLVNDLLAQESTSFLSVGLLLQCAA